MNCPFETEEKSEWLLAYCAGKLDAARAGALESHLKVCPVCRNTVRDQQAVWHALDCWETAPVSMDFDRRLRRRIERESRLSWWQRITRPLAPVLLHRGLPLAAAVSLLVMAGALFVEPEHETAFSGGSQASIESVQPDQVERTLEDIELLRQFTLEILGEAQPTDEM